MNIKIAIHNSSSGFHPHWIRYCEKNQINYKVVNYCILLPPDYSKMKGRERGYVYFQDYIPCNTFDIRVVVIGKRAFAIKRMNREDDFRASGSGIIMYEKHHFSENLIKKSFDLAGSLRSSSLAIDYVFLGDHPLVVEISYGFMKEGYDPCPGYWDSDLNWIAEPVDPCGWMVDLIVKSVTGKELET